MNQNIKRVVHDDAIMKSAQERDCFDKVCEFIDGKLCLYGKVLILHGLRRTGKTFLLGQVKYKYGDCVEHLEFPLKTEDGLVTSFHMSDVYDAMDECIEHGKTIILLDEITNVEDFTYDSELLADFYAKKGISIVLAGTDSLGLLLAGNNPLFGRASTIKMTYISFAEHSRVLNMMDTDEYIRYGGLMHRGLSDSDVIDDIISQKRYLDSAVSSNISRSLKRYERYNKERTNYDSIMDYTEDDISQVINRFVEDYSGKFDVSKINNMPLRYGIDFPLKRYNRGFSTAFKNQLAQNRDDVNLEYVKKINAECYLSKPATSVFVDELRDALIYLNLLSTTDVHKHYIIRGKWDHWEELHEYHIVQPAIKYFQLLEAQKMYMESPYLNELSPPEQRLLSKKLEESILGDMLEKITLFDSKNALDSKRYNVFKSEVLIDGSNVGEYDMIIYNTDTHSHYGFEVKHTKTPHVNQYKNLKNNHINQVIESNYGRCDGLSVLYRGDSFKTSDSLVYLNVAEFLKAIDHYKNAEQAMGSLLKDLPTKTLPETVKDNGDIVSTSCIFNR